MVQRFLRTNDGKTTWAVAQVDAHHAALQLAFEAGQGVNVHSSPACLMWDLVLDYGDWGFVEPPAKDPGFRGAHQVMEVSPC